MLTLSEEAQNDRGKCDVPLDHVEPNERFAPPADERGDQLLEAVMRGEMPSTVARVRVVDLVVADPPTLVRAHAALRETPSIQASFAVDLRQGRARWAVYRNDEGRLVMFDDYASYSVGTEFGIEWIEVQILGERDSA